MVKVLRTVLVVLLLGACGGEDADPTTTPDEDTANASVAISGFAFNPDALTLKTGVTVTWTNSQSGVPHTVTAEAGPWQADSGNLGTGDEFAFEFVEAGTYTYFCSIHPSMEGTITISD